MGILQVCEEYKKLKSRIENAELELSLKTNDWGADGESMFDKVTALPFE